MNCIGLVAAKSPGSPCGMLRLPLADCPRASRLPIRIVSRPCPVLWRPLQPELSRLRYIGAAVGTVEPLIACGARSPPKFGSFQISQKLIRGSALVVSARQVPPVGTYVPL